MNTIENKIANAMKNVSDVIIHLGAGVGASAALYQELGYKQLVLIEASTDLANLLSKKFSLRQNVYIRNSAISAHDKHIKFNSYSNSRYDSQLALEPEFLKNTNLRLPETKQVPAILFAQLSDEFKLTNAQYNTLILELNGYEAQFLTSLPLTELSIFSKIIVTLQTRARYVNQTDAAALNTALMEKGFRLATTEANQCIYEKDEQLSAILQMHAQQVARIEVLQNERNALTQENNSLQESLRITKTERDEQAHWNQNLKSDIETLKKEYTEDERGQSLALKLQAKTQVDLENLRAQYQQKLKQEQNLIELIRELQLKLQAAANYYHQLQLQHPELSAGPTKSNTNNTIDAKAINTPIESNRAHKKPKQDRS